MLQVFHNLKKVSQNYESKKLRKSGIHLTF